MRSGNLKHVITVERPTSWRTESGATVKEWTKVGVTRAAVRWLNGNTKESNSEIIMTETLEFTIRPFIKVNDKDRIIFDGKKYNIQSIKRLTYNTDVVVIAEVVNE